MHIYFSLNKTGIAFRFPCVLPLVWIFKRMLIHSIRTKSPWSNHNSLSEEVKRSLPPPQTPVALWPHVLQAVYPAVQRIWQLFLGAWHKNGQLWDLQDSPNFQTTITDIWMMYVGGRGGGRWGGRVAQSHEKVNLEYFIINPHKDSKNWHFQDELQTLSLEMSSTFSLTPQNIYWKYTVYQTLSLMLAPLSDEDTTLPRPQRILGVHTSDRYQLPWRVTGVSRNLLESMTL